MKTIAETNKIVKVLENYKEYDHFVFTTTRYRTLRSYTLNIYEIDSDKKIKPILSKLETILAFSKIYKFGILICLDIDTNTPHYYIY